MNLIYNFKVGSRFSESLLTEFTVQFQTFPNQGPVSEEVIIINTFVLCSFQNLKNVVLYTAINPFR